MTYSEFLEFLILLRRIIFDKGDRHGENVFNSKFIFSLRYKRFLNSNCQTQEDFEKYILEKTGESKANLWELDRFKDLKAMLNFNIGVTLENQGETDYMQLNEFRNRPILPRPSRIKLRK